MSNLLDKALDVLSDSVPFRESVFSYITVFTRAFRTCRYIALQNDIRGEGQKYFLGETIVRPCLLFVGCLTKWP